MTEVKLAEWLTKESEDEPEWNGVPVSEMSKSHLRNAVAWLKRQPDPNLVGKEYRLEWLKKWTVLLTGEQVRRRIMKKVEGNKR